MKKILAAALVIIAAIFNFWYFLAPAPGGEIIVLNYHSIDPAGTNSMMVSPEIFARELDYLIENGYHAITAKDFIAHLKDGAKLPPKPVLITFDDGYRDNFTVAWPILKEHGMPVLIFLITDYIGRFDNYLTWEEIHAMREQGAEFGSHTLSHAALSASELDDARHQLETSQAVFRWQFGEDAPALAYPCGSYDEAVMEAAKAAGYEIAFTAEYGPVRRGDNPYALKRVSIFGGIKDEFEHFKWRLERVRAVSLLYKIRAGLLDLGLPSLADLVPIP